MLAFLAILIVCNPGITVSGRFSTETSSRTKIDLPEDTPWSRAIYQRGRKSPLRVGWRCSAQVPWGLFDSTRQFVDSPESRNVWRVQEKNVHSRLQLMGNTDDHNESLLILDLWTEADVVNTSNLDHCEKSLSETLKRISTILNLTLSSTFAVRQEFFDGKLPSKIGDKQTDIHIKAAIVANLSGYDRFGERLLTLRLERGRLKFGPELPQTIAAFRKYMETEIPSRSRRQDPAVSPHWSLAPISMVMVLLATWWLPLQLWSICLVGALLTAIMLCSLLPARTIGWQSIFRRTATTASLGFFGIGFFGIAYAICALYWKELGVVNTLGYPFLVSTGLGVAGGILGENPTGTARIIAHAQLLLFLGGVIGIVAVLLRIDRGVRQRGD